MEELIPFIPGLIGVDTEAFYLYLGLLITISNLVGRYIPDSATGPLGIVRKVAKVLGLYLGNRISPAVNANDVARAVVATVPDETILESAKDLPDAVAVGAAYGNLAESLVNAAQGEGNRPSERIDGVADGSRVPDEYQDRWSVRGPEEQGAYLICCAGSSDSRTA